MKKARILLADDHELMRRGLRTALESQAGWEVCGEAVSGRQAVEMARQLRPDVVVMDIVMPEVSGLEATSQILESLPDTRIVMMTAHESGTLLRKALEAGARSYVLKSDAGRDLITAVECALEGKPFFTSAVSEVMLHDYLALIPSVPTSTASDGHLTPRQSQIVKLLAQGKTNKEVGNALGISVRTAETHRMEIMKKLRVTSLSELVRYAVRNKLVDP